MQIEIRAINGYATVVVNQQPLMSFATREAAESFINLSAEELMTIEAMVAAHMKWSPLLKSDPAQACSECGALDAIMDNGRCRECELDQKRAARFDALMEEIKARADEAADELNDKVEEALRDKMEELESAQESAAEDFSRQAERDAESLRDELEEKIDSELGAATEAAAEKLRDVEAEVAEKLRDVEGELDQRVDRAMLRFVQRMADLLRDDADGKKLMQEIRKDAKAQPACKQCLDTGSYMVADVENGPEFDSEAPCDCAAGEALIASGNQ